jgi:hypothetical protein
MFPNARFQTLKLMSSRPAVSRWTKRRRKSPADAVVCLLAIPYVRTLLFTSGFVAAAGLFRELIRSSLPKIW